MAWLEIAIETASSGIEDVAAALTAGGFSDLLMEDQQEFESFLEDNRAYWDYIDEGLQQKLQGLSQIKLYLEDTDESGLARLKKVAESRGFDLEISEMPEVNWEESWKDNYPAVEGWAPVPKVRPGSRIMGRRPP